jgi:carbon monoxide dehydrogenase subunit G
MQIEVSRHVAAPAEKVWAVIADVGNSAQVVSAIDSIEMVVGPSPVAVGTTWRETRTMFGRPSTQELTVSAVEVGRSYTVRTHSGGSEFESTITVEPDGVSDSTMHLTLGTRSTSSASRLLGATVGRAFAGAARKALEQDLADLASAAELGHAGEGPASGDSGGRPFGP